MAFDFPNSPTPGQIVTGPGGIQWIWDGIKWTVINNASPGVAPINNPIFTGDPQAPTPPYGDNDQSLSNTSFVQSAVTPLSHNVGRNILHNSQFNVQQRGTGPWSAGGYTADRWTIAYATDTITGTLVGLNDADRTALGDETAASAAQLAFIGTSTAGAYSQFAQYIETIRRLSGKTVTVSFWARATSGAPRIGIGWLQLFGTGGSPSAPVSGNFGVTPALSTAWQRYVYTGALPSAVGKTFGNYATDFSHIEFWLSDNGSFAGRSGGIGVQSGTVQFWGMQLEIGPTATPLEKLDPRLDLANCQRFFFSDSTYSFIVVATANASGHVIHYLPVTMRAAPTLTVTGTPGYANASGLVITPLGNSGFYSSLTVGTPGGGQCYFTFQASADL